MPNRDRTGPTGAGPRTGRGLGSCTTGTTSTPRRRPANRARRQPAGTKTDKRGRSRNIGYTE